MNKLLTIVIPAYNMEKYLDRCLSSLIVGDEKMQHLEVLVINDGSKDRTSEIAHTYEERFPDTFRLIDKENGHYGSCVNRGLREARGSYVKVLDADDYFCPGFADYLCFLKETAADLVLTDSISKDDRGNVLSQSSFPLPDRKTLAINSLTAYGIHHLNHFNLTYRTSILREMDYRQTEGISYTDLEWCSLPVGRVSFVSYMPVNVYCYLRGRVGQTIDITYRKKNMWMENQVVLGLAKKFEAWKGGIASDNLPVFKSIISSFIVTVYRHYLILSPHDLKEAEIIDFDKSLQQISDELYKSVIDTKESRKFGTYYYIKDFRNNNGRPQLKYLLFDICMSLGSLYNRIRLK